MSDPLLRTPRANRGLMVLLATVLVMGAVHFSVVHPRAFLNLYFLPVVVGAYRLDRRRGVCSALLAILVAGTALLANQRPHLGVPSLEGWMRLLDFATWGGILVFTACLVGSLSEQKQQRLAEIRRAHGAVLEVMHKFIDSVDRDTGTHSSRVADHSMELARTMGLSETNVEGIRVGAWLHDIGQMESVMEVLRQITEGDAGANLNGSNGGALAQVISVVISHHERWDGTGSLNLKGDEIPLGARIVAVANTFDTIVTDGPYRGSKSHAEAIRAIQLESGQAFDPQVVEAFLKLRTASTEGVTLLPLTRFRGTVEILPAAIMNGSESLATRPA